MATSKVSRNAFTAASQRTMADLIAMVKAETSLPKAKRQNWTWGLRTVCRVAGKEPEAVPAHPDFVRRLLAKAAPTAAGLTRAAWNNARSCTNKAMAWASITSMPCRYYQTPMTAEWTVLWSKLPQNTALAYQLSRLLHYCSANDILPEQVTDEVLAKFYEALVAESLVKNPWEIYRGAAKNWNNAADRIPGWPPRRLNVPTRRGARFTLPWSEFPTSLRSEIEEVFERASRIDLDNDFGKELRPRTIKTRRDQLLWFLSALVHSGVPAKELTSLTVVLAPDMVKGGLEYLAARRGGQRFVALANLAQFLPALARRIKLPSDRIEALKRFKRKLAMPQTGMADRHKPTLRRFNEPAAVQALVGFSDRIRDQVERSGKTGYRTAKLMQTALAVDLLLYAPVRLHNLASIEIARHLIEVQAEPPIIHLRFAAKEVKNNNDLEFPLPIETLELLDLYLTTYRPLLIKQPTRFLFPGKGTEHPKCDSALRDQIITTVREYTALEITPHRFRHAVGKIYLDRHPGQYGVVQRMLGHKRIETTSAFYAGEEGAAAARQWQKTFLSERRAGRETEDVDV